MTYEDSRGKGANGPHLSGTLPTRLTSEDAETSCEDALAKSMAVLSASRVALLLVGRTGALHTRSVLPDDEERPLCRKVAEAAARTNATVIVHNTSSDVRTAEVADASAVAVVAIPLHHGGENLGVLYLELDRPIDAEAETALRVCDLIAGQLSAEIQVARIATVLAELRT